MSNSFATTALLLALGCSTSLSAGEPDAAQVARFESKIRPLLAAKCLECHSAEARKGGLNLESGAGLAQGGDSGPVVVAGAPDESRLIEVVRQTGDIKMPPESKLSDEDIALLAAWVQDGAVWPRQRVTIGLGNLFDDSGEVGLADALASDEFKATAEADDLGVDRVLHGWGSVAEVAPAFRFDFEPLGSDDESFDTVVNDAWGGQGGLRTQGEPLPADNDRAENGIGMHANVLIAFDLAEIRRAGGLADSQDFTFRSDRAGLNDDVFGSGSPSVYLAALVIQPPDANSPARLTAYVNGRRQDTLLADGVWRLTGEVPPPLRADGRFVEFNVSIPGDARYLVLAATGADRAPDNSINSDHAVFSEARLELLADAASLFVSTLGAEPRKFTITPENRAYWAFQPVSLAAPPVVRDTSWPQTTIDRFVLAELERQGLAPSPAADRVTLIRRLTFDLTGLPPTPAEIATFVSDDSDGAYARLIDRLLASPRYGERWGRHWLDVARYAEDQAHTFQARAYPSGYRYRDWVVRSLNDDLPYDQFIVQQIAGDLLPDATATDQLAALGYFALGPVYYADAGCAAKAALDELDDRVDTLAAGFLGLTVACARCHDHKFDPISQQDYYALAGIFASSKYHEAPLAPQEVVDQYEQGQAGIRQAEERLNQHLDAEAQRVAAPLARESARYLIAAWRLAHPAEGAAQPSRADLAQDLKIHELVLERWQNWLKPENREKAPALAPWFALAERSDLAATADQPAPPEVASAAEAAQTALVEALDERDRLEREYQSAREAAPEAEKDKVAKPALDKSQSDLLAVLMTQDGPLAIPRDRVEPLLDEPAVQQLAAIKSAVETSKQSAPARYPFAHSLTEGTPADMKLHIRGSPTRLGAETPRRFLEILTPGEPARFTAGSGRLELARAIASPGNPLTARVIVNRIWMHHFGRGIVATPSNFGQMGERPSHPRLLDYLAQRLIDQGWSLKAIHREILLSAAYRQSSAYDAARYERDPDNVWLWRMNRWRLDAESWRDALLAVSGGLQYEVGGPPGDLADPAFSRRTLYGAVSRHSLDGMLRLFDFPDPNLTSARRTLTTVPLQQLFVLNSEFMVRRAKELAASLTQDPSGDDVSRVQQAYLLLYGRPATEQESQWGVEFLRPLAIAGDDQTLESVAQSQLSRWEQYAQVLLASNEFTYID